MLTLSNLRANVSIKSARAQKLSKQLDALQALSDDKSSEPINLDFNSCDLDDKSFDTVVQLCIELFKKNEAIKVSTFDFSGNSLTDGCTNSLIDLIRFLPDTDFLTGNITVSMGKENFEAVQTAIETRKTKGGENNTVFIQLENKKAASLKP